MCIAYICMYIFVYAFGKSPCLNITCVNILLGSGKKVLVRIFYIHLCICVYISMLTFISKRPRESHPTGKYLSMHTQIIQLRI